jgi:hypothetical protein
LTWYQQVIRAMADYVTEDVECDGLWKAFSYLGLI